MRLALRFQSLHEANTLASTPLEFLDPKVERVTFCRQRRASPLNERELVLEVRREGVKARGNTTVRVGGTEYQTANVMKQDGASAHETGLKSSEQRHFCAVGPEVGRKAAERFDLRMAGQFDGWPPYGVHPSGNYLAVQDNHSANRQIALTLRLLGEANSFPEKRKVIL